MVGVTDLINNCSVLIIQEDVTQLLVLCPHSAHDIDGVSCDGGEAEELWK